jgi:hypothetical protein
MDELDESRNGVDLTWAQLQELAAPGLDLVDVVLVGGWSNGDFPQVCSDDALSPFASAIICLVDSSCWRVFERDVTVVERLRAAFSDTR